MCINTINEIKEILVKSGYEKELNDILFIEDIEPLDLEPIEFEPLDLDFEPLDLDFEPLEFDELY